MTTETFRRADHRPVPTSAHEAEASAVALRAPSEASASCCFPLDITHSPSRRRLSKEIVGRGIYCEETVFVGPNDRRVFGVGLIPLGPGSDDHARAVFLLRAKGESVEESAFRTQLLTDAKSLARRIVSQTWRKGGELRSRSGAST